MKKINMSIITIATLTLLLLSGCSNFLDEKPKGRDVVHSIEHFNGLFNQIAMKNITYPHWVFKSEEFITDTTIWGNMTLAERNAFRWEADIFTVDDFPSMYSTFYRQIYIQNIIANGVMNASDGTHEERVRLLAEARVSRAWNYMMLVQFFGRPFNPATAATDLAIPLNLEASTGITSFTRATVQEVYNFILRELEESVPLLGTYTLHRQRLYRAAGFAILGRVYMLIHEYEKAVEALAQAKEALALTTIEIRFFDYQTEMATWQADRFTWEAGLGYPHNYDVNNTELIYNRNIVLGLGGIMYRPKVLIRPEYMALLVDGDLRREFYSRENLSNYRRDFRVQHNEGVCLPNLYLMYAESLARVGGAGNLTKARELVTDLRRSRFAQGFDYSIPANVVTQNDLIRFVVEERLREFMGTGHRWFDMRRLWNDPLFQDLKENYTHTDGVTTWRLIDENRLVFRIPPSVMLHNPGWANNP